MRNDGIGAICNIADTVPSAILFLLKRCHDVFGVFSAACSCSSVGVRSVIKFRAVFGSVMVGGTPIVESPSPLMARILLSIGEVIPIPLVPYPRPYMTLTMFECGTLIRAVYGRFSAFSCVRLDSGSRR